MIEIDGKSYALGDPVVLAVLAGAAQTAGWSGYDAEALAADASLAQTLEDQRAQIQSDGVFGVPFLIDGRDRYWGQDRFDLWVEERTACPPS